MRFSMKIERSKTIPIPGGFASSVDKYHFGEMEIGDSIYVEGWNDGMRLRWAAAAYRQYHPGWSFKSRMENARSNDTLPGMRIWRIA